MSSGLSVLKAVGSPRWKEGENLKGRQEAGTRWVAVAETGARQNRETGGELVTN